LDVCFPRSPLRDRIGGVGTAHISGCYADAR
jgi:hypothetical protein